MNKVAFSVLLVLVLFATRIAGAQGDPARRGGAPPGTSSKIDLNIASAQELTGLPGVDAALATSIIAGRPYGSVAELARAGVPPTTIDKITPLVMVSAATAPPSSSGMRGGPPGAPPGAAVPGGPRRGSPSAPPGATVNLNTASQEELQSLPGVDAATAKRIVAARPYGSAADLSKAGVPSAAIAKIASRVTVGPSAPPGALTGPTSTTGPRGASDAGYRMGPPVPGIVWVNTATKTYFSPGDLRIGSPSEGNWILETDAIKKGYHAASPPAKR